MAEKQSAVYVLNHRPLASGSGLAGLAQALGTLPSIDSQSAFNGYCQEACRLWGQYFPEGRGTTSGRFRELLGRVDAGGEGVIPTPWGGVVVTRHAPPQVEKYLVIHQGGYLALETHSQKLEHLEVQEGAGLILWRSEADHALAVQELKPGETFDFRPGMEHCIIGTEDLLVFETSSDPKGMDQDLIFIYTPL